LRDAEIVPLKEHIEDYFPPREVPCRTCPTPGSIARKQKIGTKFHVQPAVSIVMNRRVRLDEIKA